MVETEAGETDVARGRCVAETESPKAHGAVPMASSVAAGNLPTDVTQFLGRRLELAEIKQRFGDTRLLTLTGPGGVGKTRLALRLSGDMRRAFRDGVWLVELAELQDPNLLGHTVGAALGLREQSATWQVGALADHLAQRQMILLLDNCEHLLDACAELVDTLLRACPHLRVLTTSREPLGISGESVVVVPPLSVPQSDGANSIAVLSQCDSVALFLDRAIGVDPAFALTKENCSSLARLCQMLEGIPLALELAAVRLRSLSLDDMVDRMSNPYRLLTRGSRTAPRRQQTLRASIDWTFDLCAPEERMLWTRLSVFAGSFELDAAEGVCSGDGLVQDSILDLVTALVDKSVIIKREGVKARYQMLETIRQYGEEQLIAADDSARWRRRHRDWYATLVALVEEEWIGPDQPQLIARLRREQANLRKSLDFCVSDSGEATLGLAVVSSLEQFWLIRGLMSEGRLWLDRLLPLVDEPTVDRARGLRLYAFFATLQGDYDVAEAALDRAEPNAQQSGDPVAQAYVSQAKGALAMFRGDLATAISLFESATTSFRAQGWRIGEALTLFQCGMAAGLAGDDEKAMTKHRECLSMTEPLGEGWFRSWSLWAMGMDAWRRRDNKEAAAFESESLRIKRELDDQMGIAVCLEAMAWVFATEHQGLKAEVLLGAAEAIWRRITMSLSPIPPLWAYREEAELQARSETGDRAFDEAFARGMRLTLEQAVAYALNETVREPTPTPTTMDITVLTSREREVSELVGAGLSNRAIAERLVISPRTAEAHVEHIFTKLGFTSRSQVAAWIAEQRAERPHSDS
jgi:predicted ATPase/DNA-binding CsgD family transcriptional regulator